MTAQRAQQDIGIDEMLERMHRERPKRPATAVCASCAGELDNDTLVTFSADLTEFRHANPYCMPVGLRAARKRFFGDL